MNESDKKQSSSFDKNGEAVRITEHGSSGSRAALFYKLLALVLVGCFVGYLVTIVIQRSKSAGGDTNFDQSASDQTISDASVSNASDSALSAANTARDHKLTARPAHLQIDRNDLSNYVAAGEAPRMEEVIKRLHDAGIHEGLGAFSPPGTSPPMIGLAVPDAYALPEGYVRHFQATDDGQRIEPILMYSPDFNFFDSTGQQIIIPADRVVPANMAPPGLAIRPITIPKPLEPTGP